MKNDIMDDSDDKVCSLNRSDSLLADHLETPTVEGIQSRMGTIKDISDQFVEDVNAILENCGNSHYVIMFLSGLMNDIAERLNGENDRITVDTINEPNSNDMPDFKWIDGMHILQTILSRQLPPECYGGIINLILATQLANATTEEIEDSLRYLYGAGPHVPIANIPPLPSEEITADDMNNARMNADTLDLLKSMIDLRPQVIEDISAMLDKFPHDNTVSAMLLSFVGDLVVDLHADTAKIDAVSIKGYFDKKVNIHSFWKIPNQINAIESIFSARLEEEVYCGLINLMNAFSPNASIEDIDKALEYLYGPKDDESQSI